MLVPKSDPVGAKEPNKEGASAFLAGSSFFGS